MGHIQMSKQHLCRFWTALDSRRATYAFLGFGLLLRVAALGMAGSGALGNEAPGYYRTALQLLHQEEFSPYWPPGLPYYLYVVQRVLGESILVARASILPFYILFSVFLYRLARLITSRTAANLAVLVFAVYPPYIRYAFNPSTEYPAAAFLLGGLYFTIRAIRARSVGLTAAMGLCLGALTLIRPSCALFVLVVPVYFLLNAKQVRMAFVPVAVCSLLIAAWLVKAHSLTGRWVLINEANSENLFFGNNPYTPLFRTWPEGQAEIGFPAEFRELLQRIRNEPEEVRAHLYRRIALRHILSRPDLFIFRTLNRMRAYFGFPVHHGEPLGRYLGWIKPRWLLPLGLTALDVAFYWPIMALAIFCTFHHKFRLISGDPVVAILGAALVYALPYWVTFSQPRFNFPVVPLLAVLAVKFLDQWIQGPREQGFNLLSAPGRRRAALLGTLSLFAYIQLEWIAVFYFKV
jgi:4-amino-4-deoxy-L-arabinose transferase-like glycosyltransferase